MSISEMIVKLQEYGCFVQRVEHDTNMLHVDGDCLPNARGLPEWIYGCHGWGVSSCGWARVFLHKSR